MTTATLPPMDDQPQLADMVRILDVAAEMRSDRELASREFAVDDAKQLLRERLLASARLTGDTATPAEIDAAIEQYYQSLYTFKEPRWRLAIVMAHMYVRRIGITVVTVLLTAGLCIGWTLFNPASGRLSSSAQQAKRWTAELHDVELLGSAVKTGARDPQVAARVDELMIRLHAAQEQHNPVAVQEVRHQLSEWQSMLAEEFEVRIVTDPNSKSGIDRYFNDSSGKRVSGYYLIVQAHTADGRVLPRAIHNVETGQAETVSIWGEYVPDEVWERIKADKKSDGILDETLFAVKQRGELTPQIVMNGVAKEGVRRQITKW